MIGSSGISPPSLLPRSIHSAHPDDSGSVRRKSRPDAARTRAKSVPDPFVAASPLITSYARRTRIAPRDAGPAMLLISSSPRTRTSANGSGLDTRARSRAPSGASPKVITPSQSPRSLPGRRRRRAILLYPYAVSRRTDSTGPDLAPAPAPEAIHQRRQFVRHSHDSRSSGFTAPWLSHTIQILRRPDKQFPMRHRNRRPHRRLTHVDGGKDLELIARDQHDDRAVLTEAIDLSVGSCGRGAEDFQHAQIPLPDSPARPRLQAGHRLAIAIQHKQPFLVNKRRCAIARELIESPRDMCVRHLPLSPAFDTQNRIALWTAGDDHSLHNHRRGDNAPKALVSDVQPTTAPQFHPGIRRMGRDVIG